MSASHYRHQPKLAELSKYTGLKNYPRRIFTLFKKAAEARDALPSHLRGKSRIIVLHEYDDERTSYLSDRNWSPSIGDFRKTALPFMSVEKLLGSDRTPSPTCLISYESPQGATSCNVSSCSTATGTSAEVEQTPGSTVDLFDFSQVAEDSASQLGLGPSRVGRILPVTQSTCSSPMEESPASTTSSVDITSRQNGWVAHDDEYTTEYCRRSPEPASASSSIWPESPVRPRRIDHQSAATTQSSSVAKPQHRRAHESGAPSASHQPARHVHFSSRSRTPTASLSLRDTRLSYEPPIIFTPINKRPRQTPQTVDLPPSPPSSTHPAPTPRKSSRAFSPPADMALALGLQRPETPPRSPSRTSYLDKSSRHSARVTSPLPSPKRRSQRAHSNANGSTDRRARPERTHELSTRIQSHSPPPRRRSERRHAKAVATLLEGFDRFPSVSRAHSPPRAVPRQSSKRSNDHMEAEETTSSKRRTRSDRNRY